MLNSPTPFLRFIPVVFLLFAGRFMVGFGLEFTDSFNSSSVLRDSDVLYSSGRVFAMGFFSPNGSSNRYLGIWYGFSPETVVWVANRDTPINNLLGSVSISSNGDIVLTDGNGTFWSSNDVVAANSSSPASNRIVRLLDTGNLVLLDSVGGRTIWEGFNHPGNTFLPNMKQSDNPRTGVRVGLNSWRGLQDPGTGNFNSGLNSRSAVPQTFLWNANGTPRWRSGPWNGRVFTGVTRIISVFLDAFSIVTEQDDTSYISWSGFSDLIRITLEANGVFRNERWDNQSKNWKLTWSAPANDCDLYNHCGPFAQCYIKASPICSCLKGYEPRDREEWNRGNWSGGCVKRTPFRCERERNGSNVRVKEDGFDVLTSVKVPDFMIRTAGLESDCRNLCLRNCSCLGYSYDFGIGCLFWNGTLIDVQKFPDSSNVGLTFYVRAAYSELDHGNKHGLVYILSSVGSFLGASLCLFGAWWICKRKSKRITASTTRDTGETWPSDSSDIALRSNVDKVSIDELPLYTFEMLASATDGFSLANKLGMGGFGHVYKGKLWNNKIIAVKRLSAASEQGFQEFMNEVYVISKLQHRNLVRLLGCCAEKEEKMLVYEYVPNRSLDVFLFDKTQSVLDWRKRFNIIEGIGRGLLYLHRDSRLRIIHRDLKPSNILLDEDWNPKISDFGMARIFGGNQDQAKTGKVVGTYGYMAPEYVIGGRFSEKSDVFSYGVLVLEIVSGRKNNSFSNDESFLSLLEFAWKLWNEDRAVEIIDKRIYDSRFHAEMIRCIHIGLLCVQEYPVNRPTISTVLLMLSSEIADLPMPTHPHPGFTDRSLSVGSLSHSANTSLTTLEGR